MGRDRTPSDLSRWLANHSDDATIGEDGLAIDPGAIAITERRNNVRDIGRLSQTLVRRTLYEAFDLLGRLAIGEKRRVDQTRRDGVHRNLPPREFLGQHA